MNHFKDKVVYQIYPKSFCDTNGDGIGDLKGITSRLDYLQMLGVDYLWLTPFFVSPQRDNGYDIADYRRIDPVFGTMDDFEELAREADQRGIGLMLDMVFNHTSTQHEWFQKALAGEKEYQDYYIFRDGTPDQAPTNWISKFGGSAWEYLPSLGKWYLHLFDVSQADLNWENPKVRQELKDIIFFWKEKGVSGFRFDVVNLISKPEEFLNDHEGDGRRFYTDGRHVHVFLKELVQDTGIGDMITVGEMSSTSLEHCLRYAGEGSGELTMCFNFHHLKIDYGHGDKWELAQPDLIKLKELFHYWQEGMQAGNSWNALFWCNHDQPRIVSRLGDENLYWKESAKSLAACIHLMRGTPYIYQGEELGMMNAHFNAIEQYRDVESLNYYRILLDGGLKRQEALGILAQRSRDNSRTPMQWDDTPGRGFTAGIPWIGIPEYGSQKKISVASETADPDSILQFYRKLIRIRKEYETIAEGDIRFLNTGDQPVIAYERIPAEGAKDDRRIRVYCNLSGQDQIVRLPQQRDGQIKCLENEAAECKNIQASLQDSTPEILIHTIPDAPVIADQKLHLKPWESVAFIG